MRTVWIEPRFAEWRDRARDLLGGKVPPEAILWEEGRDGSGSLFGEMEEVGESEAGGVSRQIPIRRAFFDLAELVACHGAPERWAVLYRVAWRITHGGERQLLDVETDRDVKRLTEWAKAVRRARHKMTAFVRFRKVGECGGPDGQIREQFAAWFEPEFDIVELTAPFFRKRFSGMDWSILTPWKCAHWDGVALHFTPGVAADEAPDGDRLEDYWLSYYAHIFNPARLKLKAMAAEMPKKYWKNLPEAPLIAELTRDAQYRTTRMIEAEESAKSHVSQRLPGGIPEPEPVVSDIDPAAFLRKAGETSWEELRQSARQCRACPLHERATHTVFGEGPPDAEVMIVGEQPGDAEDLAGRPFCGPSGEMLDAALAEVGIDRSRAYVTNVVKHFKWKRRGKRRLHQTPSANEVHVCRPWVLAEIFKVQPRTLICLGATAAKALIRPDFILLRDRGLVAGCDLAAQVIATVHPSYLLRLPKGADRDREHALWLRDLRMAETG